MILCASCSDFLDKKPLDRYTDAVVWEDPALIDLFLLSQYAYTPVMVNDATTMFSSWDNPGSPMNRDPRAQTNLRYWFGNSAQTFGPGLTIELCDEAKYTTGAWANAVAQKLHGITSDGGLLEWWENAYYTIRNLNDFIARVPNSPISENLKDTRVAEARFLRAYCYFAMVKRYGGVPLLKEAPQLDSPDELLYPKRATEQEVWDFILEETDEISKILPPVADQYGRATSWAALALRSRAALYAGSIAKYGEYSSNKLTGLPRESADTYFEESWKSAKLIKEEGPFDLYEADIVKGDADSYVENFKNVFLVKRNCEIIMAKQHGGNSFDPGGGTATWSWDLCHAPVPSVWNQGNYQAPYYELIEQFEMADGSPVPTREEISPSDGERLWTMDELWAGRDPRFYASIWTNGTEWRDAPGSNLPEGYVNFHNGLIKPDGTILTSFNESYEGMPAVGAQADTHAKLGETNTGFGIMKYLDPEADNMIWFMESRTDYAIFRYAEVLLNFAEAAMELGKDGDALEAVNRIRERAGITALKSVDMNKIRHERRIELVFENHRYWDMRRWRIAHNGLLTGADAENSGLDRTFTGVQYLLDYSTRKYKVLFINEVDGKDHPTFPKHNYYFPITKARIAQNTNLVENPGYDTIVTEK